MQSLMSAVGPGAARRRVWGALAAVVLVLAAGCGADDAGAQPSPGGLEQTTVQVGMLPIIDTAAVNRAQIAGYFADEGLTVEFVPVQGGSAAIPLLVPGDLDMTWSATNAIISAEYERVVEPRGGLRVLPGSGYAAAANTFVMLILGGREDLRTAQDLPGKTIAINTLGSIAKLAANSALAVNGVDPASVDYVQIPFPDMVPALALGQVDAIVTVEPFLTLAATQLGAVTVLDVASGPTANLLEAALVTTGQFARDNPRTLAAFARALSRAQEDMTSRAIIEQTVLGYTKIDAGTAALMVVGTWPLSTTTVDLARVAGLMQTDGVLPAGFDVAPLLLDPPA